MSVLSRVVFNVDTTAPSIPLSVAAVAQSQTTIRITWAASTDTGGAGLAGYRVYRSTTSGGTYTQVGSDLTTASLAYDDTSLSASQTRFYRVLAFDGNANASALSSIVSATTTAAVGGPTYAGYTPTIYAASTARGNGSGSSEANATTFASALATVSAAGAGIVGAVDGVISGTGSGTHWESIFSVTGSGTVLNPIVVVAKYPSTQYPLNPELWTELRSANTAVPQPVIGVYPFRSNVRFIGFYINQVHVPPAASNGSALSAYETSGIWFERFTFDQTVNATNDNFNSIFSAGSNGLRIRNCRFRGGANAGNHNASAITTYGPEQILFEHNEFEGCNTCVFIKGLDTNDGSFNSGTIRYNKSTGASGEFIELTTVDPVNGIDVYQNLSIGDGYGINLDNSGSTVTDARVESNTVINPTNLAFGADLATLADHVLRNNLVYWTAPTSARAVDYGQNSTASVSPMDFNLYFVAGGTPQFRQSSTIYSGLPAWRTATGKETNSVSVDPLLTVDYHLQAASPARTASHTGGPVGAYITGSEVIGIEP